MKKTFYSVIICLFLMYSCSYNTKDECLKNLKANFTIKGKDKQEINLKTEVNCFEWDSLMLIDRHFDAENVKKVTGVNLNGYRLMGIQYFSKSDFNTYIAFLKNKEIVGVIETSKVIDIDDLITELDNNDMAIISKNDAVFKIYTSDNKFVNGDEAYALTFSDKKLVEKYKRKQ